jgi:hypothetical protein
MKTLKSFWDVTLHCWASSSYVSSMRTAFRTLQMTCPVTHHRIPKDLNLQQHKCRALKSCIIKYFIMYFEPSFFNIYFTYGSFGDVMIRSDYSVLKS